MARRARTVIPGIPHHITQRGNHKKQIFFDDIDREYFLKQLRHYATKFSVQIAAYCLMNNHTHLTLIPPCKKSLGEMFRPMSLKYSQYLNRKFDRTGLNWQGRFFSSAMDDTYTWNTFQYIALNPVKAKIVGNVADFQWSSAAAHLGLREDPILNADKKWLEMAASAVSEIGSNSMQKQNKIFAYIERSLAQNLPYGTSDFIQKLENETGLILKPNRIGRPKNA